MSDNKTKATEIGIVSDNALVNFWRKYFVFNAIYWRAIIFISLIVSMVLLWPYIPVVLENTDGYFSVPVKRMVGDYQTMVGYPQSIPEDAIKIDVETPEYVSSGRTAKYSFVYRQTAPIPTIDQKVTFKIVPETLPDEEQEISEENLLAAAISETILTETLPKHWQATTNVFLEIPADYTENDLKYMILVETEPNCSNNENGDEDPVCKTPPLLLSSKELTVSVVRWPTYIAQLLLFIGSLGFFSINQIGPALLKLLLPGYSNK
jgi:hypothetical protein